MSVEDELKKIFSNPRGPTQEGIIAAGGKMSPELLIFAYEHGVFPWPHEGYPLLWFSPDERGILDFADLHLSRSFLKWMRQKQHLYKVTINQHFSEVIRQCRSMNRKGQNGSWINDEIEKNYNLLHQSGHAYSLEVLRNGELVGGIYGVQSKRYFSCESMFHLEDNTSKLAFYELTKWVRAQNHTWLDIQMVTETSENFGGKLILKEEFLKRIGK